MADNVGFTPGTGATIATDEVAGIGHVQYNKLMDGLLDSTIKARIKDVASVAGDGGLVVRPVPGMRDSAGVEVTDPILHAVCVSIVGDTVGSAVGTENGTVASGQANVALTVALPYHYNGSGWERGGVTPHTLTSAASTNATSVKASAAVLEFLIVSNTNASARWLKFSNTVGAPTPGTTPVVLKFLIPGGTTVEGRGTNIPIPEGGIKFTTGLSYCITAGVADSDVAAIGASDVVVNIGYR